MCKSFDELSGGEEFLQMLSVCHTVIPETSNNGDITYQASSPDEAALVTGAKLLGHVFHTRKPRSITINVDGHDKVVEILAVNEFNSCRKRMSVIVRIDDVIKIMVKGAETVVFERCQESQYLNATVKCLEEYASVGLRTLVFASRVLDETEYQAWKLKHEEAMNSISNRQQMLDDVAELVETRLELVGATAVEDKLQDGVPETISTLMEAGIKVWVLTGDRQETAINIGMSCKLIKPKMTQIIVNEESKHKTLEFIKTHLEEIRSEFGMGGSFELGWYERFWRNIGSKGGRFSKIDDAFDIALIIDGKSLEYALDPEISILFLELAMLCKAVVCCRVSPLQKAMVVKLVKDNVAGSVTLAIGDGANDVSMIQAAHVGVGISGQEGLQAARSSDFAIAQFRFLRKLLLVHGGWAYSRVSKTVAIMFYKNLTLYLIQFWFALNNNFSAMTLFETWSSVSSYNVIWTILPPILIGIFDQYVSAKVLISYPEMYKVGQQDHFYNHKIFIGFVVNSIFHSCFLFYVWYFILGEGDILYLGLGADNWVFGVMVYATTLVSVMMKHLLYASTITFWVFISILGSVLAYFLGFPLYATFAPQLGFSNELFNVTNQIVHSYTFWMALILVPVATNLRDYTWK